MEFDEKLQELRKQKFVINYRPVLIEGGLVG